MDSDFVHVRGARTAVCIGFYHRNGSAKENTGWKTEKSMSIYNPWVCTVMSGQMARPTSTAAATIGMLSTVAYNVCEIMDSTQCHGNIYVSFSPEHIFHSSMVHAYNFASFDANPSRRRSGCDCDKFGWKMLFVRRRELKTIHAALSGIYRGTNETKPLLRHHEHSRTRRQCQPNGNVLARSEHKRNSLPLRLAVCVHAFRCIPRFESLRNFVLRDSNLDAMESDERAHTAKMVETVRSTATRQQAPGRFSTNRRQAAGKNRYRKFHEEKSEEISFFVFNTRAR